MTRPSERLPQLVPGIYGARDSVLAPGGPLGDDVDGEASGRGPLARLLQVLGSELDALQGAIQTLWDDHFVERASSEALPLLAELFGTRLHSDDPRVQRAVVARAIAWRRRKGTLDTLEEILSLTSLWDVEVEEAFRSLLATQDLNELVPWRGRTTVLWDPIGLSDPLSRRSAGVYRPLDGGIERGQIIGRAPEESIDQALRRLGRADAGRAAASPRTLDLLGWARPDVALIRAARLVSIELEEVTPRAVHQLPNGYLGVRVDPLDRDGPLVWLAPLERADLAPGLTIHHEPPPPEPEPERTAARLLTPTALAEDPDAAERAGAFTISVEGIPLVGPPPLAGLRGAMVAEPVGPAPTLRFADELRPSPDDAWTLTLLAAREDRDIPLMTVSATHGETGDVDVTPEGQQILNGASIALMVTRAAGKGRARDAAGVWTPLDPGGPIGEARSPVALVVSGGARWIVRAEQHLAAAALRLARFRLPDGQWEAVDIGGARPADGPGLSAVGDGADVLLVTGDGTGRLGVWRVADAAGTPVATRIDAGGPRLPPARLDATVCTHGDRLFVYGGDLGGAPTGDLWSIPLAGGPWRPHAVRHRQERIGATLISTPTGLVLIGGQEAQGELAVDMYRADPAAPSPAWRKLAPLPIDRVLPGELVARLATDGVEALVWADRTRPRRMLFELASGSWIQGDLEEDGCNPPASGEALFDGDALLVVGPPPLPPADVVFSMGGEGHIVFLPTLDLTPFDGIRFHVASDGATFADPRPGQALPLHTRPGGLLHEQLESAVGPARRYSVPERIERHPFVLRQRSLAPWDKLIASDEDGVVELDPRLGRVVIHDDAPRGRITISARVGRGAAIGAGAMPKDRAPRRGWHEPGETVPVPPDLRNRRSLRARAVTAWISPPRAGGTLAAQDGDRPIVATPEDGMVASTGTPLLGVLASPRLPPTRFTSGVDDGVSLFAADFGSVPVVDADEHGVSLAIHPHFGGHEATQIWLAGLWLAGRAELVLARGQADLRWCNLGVPGEIGLWLPGAGHQDAMARRSIPPTEVEIRLYGCMVGAIELPPWARLHAAGCTFDAGARDAVAIRAAGARVRLRQCTVLGAVEAGTLEASSCAFAGEVRADRPDLGWVRYSLLPPGGSPPLQHLCQVHHVSFASANQTDPNYLVLARNNGPHALRVGEWTGIPGAHGERTDHERELDGRTSDNLPIGMIPFHADRTTADLFRMGRR